MLLLVVLDEGDLLAPPVEGARGVPVPVDVVDPVVVVVRTWNVGKEIFRKKTYKVGHYTGHIKIWLSQT